MKYKFCGLTIVLVFLFNVAFAASPPFKKVTITGKTLKKYNKVSLFKSGKDKKPYKTASVNAFNGAYKIQISIPGDMKKKNGYYITDMRFWHDANDNRIKDKGEDRSKCHFIIWDPNSGTVYMDIYKGDKLPIESSTFRYYYKG